jgi:hypothetical protein
MNGGNVDHDSRFVIDEDGAIDMVDHVTDPQDRDQRAADLIEPFRVGL